MPAYGVGFIPCPAVPCGKKVMKKSYLKIMQIRDNSAENLFYEFFHAFAGLEVCLEDRHYRVILVNVLFHS